MEFNNTIIKNPMSKDSIKVGDHLYKITENIEFPGIVEVDVTENNPDYEYTIEVESDEYSGMTDLYGLYKLKSQAQQDYVKILKEMRNHINELLKEYEQ